MHSFTFLATKPTYIQAYILWEREREIYLFSGVESSGSTSNNTNAQRMGRESWKTSGKPGPCLEDRHFRWEFELYAGIEFRFSIPNVVYMEEDERNRIKTISLLLWEVDAGGSGTDRIYCILFDFMYNPHF